MLRPPRTFAVVREGRTCMVSVRSAEELLDLRIELELLQRFRRAAPPNCLPVLERLLLRLKRENGEPAGPRADGIADMCVILRDAAEPVNIGTLACIDADYPQIRRMMPMSSLEEEASRFQTDLTAELASLSGAAAKEPAGHRQSDPSTSSVMEDEIEQILQASQAPPPALDDSMPAADVGADTLTAELEGASNTVAAGDEATTAEMPTERMDADGWAAPASAAESADAVNQPHQHPCTATSGKADLDQPVPMTPTPDATEEVVGASMDPDQLCEEIDQLLHEMDASVESISDATSFESGGSKGTTSLLVDDAREQAQHAANRLDELSRSLEAGIGLPPPLSVESLGLSPGSRSSSAPTSTVPSGTLSGSPPPVSPSPPPASVAAVNATRAGPATSPGPAAPLVAATVWGGFRAQVQEVRDQLIRQLDRLNELFDGVQIMQAQARQAMEYAREFERAAQDAHRRAAGFLSAQQEAEAARTAYEQAQARAAAARAAWEAAQDLAQQAAQRLAQASCPA